MQKAGQVFIALLFSLTSSKAQDSSFFQKIVSFPLKGFSALEKKAGFFQQKMDKKTERYLSQLEKQERNLLKKLSGTDTVLAKQLHDQVALRFNQLKRANGKVNKYQCLYSGHLDSVFTLLKFIEDRFPTLPPVQQALEQCDRLQLRLNAFRDINEILFQEQEEWKKLLGPVKELKRLHKKFCYYQQQIKQYVKVFEHPSQQESELMQLATASSAFQDYFAHNSLLGSLFPLALSSGHTEHSVPALQTRAAIDQALSQRLGKGFHFSTPSPKNTGTEPGLFLSDLRKLTLANYRTADAAPDDHAYSQQTRPFLHRLVYDVNIQSQKARNFFPVTTDLGLSVGYRINDQSTVGAGAACKLGWGSGWNNMNFTQQGVSLRSFIDWKIKGRFYINGEYEQNYRSLIHSSRQLKNYSAWKASGLLGISKKYTINRKLNGELKLLWDFLSHHQLPSTQPLVFRIGYSLR